jgi:hypothetical protein
MDIKFDKNQLNEAMRKCELFAGKKALKTFSNAFNRAGFDTRKKIMDDMPSIFKNLNQYTRNSIFFSQLKFKDGSTIGGAIQFKKKSSGGVGAGIYLMPEEWGGSRALKGFERRLRERGLIPEGMFAVPAKRFERKFYTPAGMTNFANILARSTVSRVSFRKGKTIRVGSKSQYFVLMQKTGRLEPGIYIRNGRRVERVFAYVSKVSYPQIFGFYDRAQRYFSTFFPQKLKDEISKL